MTNITCMYSAKKYVIENLFLGKATPIKTYNDGKHFIVMQNKVKYYCAYKREPFNSFWKEYTYEFGAKGESLNQECLKEAQRSDCENLVFIHQNEIYLISTEKFLRESILNNWFGIRKRLKKVLEKNGKYAEIQELTYSCQLNIMNKIEVV